MREVLPYVNLRVVLASPIAILRMAGEPSLSTRLERARTIEVVREIVLDLKSLLGGVIPNDLSLMMAGVVDLIELELVGRL